MQPGIAPGAAARAGRRQSPPSVSLNEALRLALPSGSKVVAGPRPTHCRVTWASVLSGRPVSLGSIEPGELIIFTPGAPALLGGESAMTRLVGDLAEAGASCFALFQPPSLELIQVAEAKAKPLLLLPAGAPPTEVERSVHSLLVDPEEQVRKRVEAVYERLLETLIEEDGAAHLARAVMAATGKATYVLDPFLQLLASASDAAEAQVPLLRQRLSEGSAGGAHPPRRLSLPGPNGTDTALVRLLGLRGTVAGLLCLVGPADEFDELDERVADRAASVLGIELAKQRAIAEARFHLQEDFLNDLLEGSSLSAEALAARARSMGYELSRPYLVSLLEAGQPASGGPAGQRLAQRLVEAARNELLRSEPGALLREREGRVAALFPLEPGSQEDRSSLVEALRSRLSAAVGAPVAAGVGRTATTIGQFPAAYREATIALEVARTLMNGNTTVDFQQLGVQRLLFQLLGNPELEAYREDMIGPLERYDARHRSDLAHTLEVFLACHGNHVRAAKALHLHRNTLLYRLERARAILAQDLDDPETRLALQLALKIRHIPRSASPSAHPSGQRHGSAPAHNQPDHTEGRDP